MINLEEIEDEISRLEHGKTTYSACEKLSVLYTVRNELLSGEDPVKVEKEYSEYSFASGSSEFVNAINGSDMSKVIDILDEHMEAIKLIYPKEYTKVCQMINETKVL